ncbi:MAG: TlpA family protein disulfide reductase [Wenzhouxiangellaceae bacterium]|nr:TlpA family protein disulfide reductase [Wenzhouxiangellaceae bacterium]
MQANKPPPAWQVTDWLNADRPLELAEFQGRVVLVHAFQMLCPGCAQHAVPQAERVHRALAGKDLIVIGLHTVFEHHQAMGTEALRAFLHEYRVTHPIGIDQPVPDQRIPATMQRWNLQGTPSMILLDRAGRVRLNRFGRVEDLELGLMLGQLLAETPPASSMPG